MFSRILIPVDLTDRALASLEAAAEFAGEGASVLLLHVIETIEDVPFEELEDFYGRIEEKAVRILERRQGELRTRGIEASYRVLFGRREREIVRYAAEAEVDLVVMASHLVEPGVRGRGLGTLSHRVALLAPCHVLLMKMSHGEPG